MVAGRHRYHVRSVERALAILGLLTNSRTGITLTRLASELGLSESTAYRLLVTLESHGYVERSDPKGGYCLGIACLNLGGAFLSKLDLRGRVLPIMEDLREEYRETVHLGMLDMNRFEVIYLEKLLGLMPVVTMGSRVGGRVPAHCTALGKCMLADLPRDLVRGFYEQHGLQPHTPNTITDMSDFLQDLAEVRQRGYAIDDVEHELGVKCVGAPIRHHNGSALGAISVSGPQHRMDHLLREQDLIGGLIAAARKASSLMGYTGSVRSPWVEGPSQHP